MTTTANPTAWEVPCTDFAGRLRQTTVLAEGASIKIIGVPGEVTTLTNSQAIDLIQALQEAHRTVHSTVHVVTASPPHGRDM